MHQLDLAFFRSSFSPADVLRGQTPVQRQEQKQEQRQHQQQQQQKPTASTIFAMTDTSDINGTSDQSAVGSVKRRRCLAWFTKQSENGVDPSNYHDWHVSLAPSVRELMPLVEERHIGDILDQMGSGDRRFRPSSCG